MLHDSRAMFEPGDVLVIHVHSDIYGDFSQTHGAFGIHALDAPGRGANRPERDIAGNQRGPDASAVAAERGGKQQDGGIAASGVFRIAGIVHDNIAQYC